MKKTGDVVNHKKVLRIMRENRLSPKYVKVKKYVSYNGSFNNKKANLLLDKVVDETTNTVTYRRNFSTTKPSQIWVTDISEFKIGSGKVYLSTIKDVHTKEIVAFKTSRSPNFKFVLEMLDEAFTKYDNLENLIFHSDQGWHYQMKELQYLLEQKGILQSMSRKGNCLDNSVMENYFGIMKNEMFYGHEKKFDSIDHLREEIANYVHFYNHERISLKLNGMSPIEFRERASK